MDSNFTTLNVVVNDSVASITIYTFIFLACYDIICPLSESNASFVYQASILFSLAHDN